MEIFSPYIILIHVSMLTTFLSVFKRCLDMYVEETIDKSFEESPQQQRQQQSSVQQHDINRLRESALSTARI